jgi:hypothetical protein
MGRHSVDEDAAEDLAAREIASTGPTAPTALTAPVLAKTSAVADLQLVLHNTNLLRACLAAAVVPFVIYVVVLVVLGRTGSWALFLGAPMVLAGIGIGALLDRAYDELAASKSSKLTPSIESIESTDRVAAEADADPTASTVTAPAAPTTPAVTTPSAMTPVSIASESEAAHLQDLQREVHV